eukprot:m.696044 g.696044  ORF g.696044 m.696044 type:complete len:167 (-) comp22891_c0_seq3:1833-2333(-)
MHKRQTYQSALCGPWQVAVFALDIDAMTRQADSNVSTPSRHAHNGDVVAASANDEVALHPPPLGGDDVTPPSLTDDDVTTKPMGGDSAVTAVRVQPAPAPMVVVQLPQGVPLPSPLPQDHCVDRVYKHLRGERADGGSFFGEQEHQYGAPLMSMHCLEVLCATYII